MNALTLCLYHAHRISRLVDMWDRMRGPVMAMPPENIEQLFSEISPVEISPSQIPDEAITPLLTRIQKAERVLTHTLTDQVYLNDDRDREIIVARIALCNVLKQLKDLDPQLDQVNLLWQKNDGDEWSTL